MTEERKKPKIRLVLVGDGLEKIAEEIKDHCVYWGHEIFMDSSGAKEPDFGIIITVLKKEKDRIVIIATIGEKKIEGRTEDLENFVIRVINALVDKLVPSYIDKAKKEMK